MSACHPDSCVTTTHLPFLDSYSKSSPMSKEKDTTNGLCRICERRLRHLDDSTLYREWSYDSFLGSWSVAQSRTSCAFCRLVVAAVNRSRRADFQARFPPDADLSPDGDEE